MAGGPFPAVAATLPPVQVTAVSAGGLSGAGRSLAEQSRSVRLLGMLPEGAGVDGM
ncbi:hypothetical protein AB0903_03945 [Streptomyces sp. NPDC048389]|uniref:hypothetical protein n=1 Tax=Streptomyces sp. NPDC048389 TaxID=3154622 RepID=UPI0034529A51